MGKTFMVCVDGCPKKNGPKLLEYFNDGKKFLFDGSRVALDRVKLFGVKGNRNIMLFYDSAKLVVRCISLHLKRLA